MSYDNNISNNGISREEFLSSIKTKDTEFKKRAIQIFDNYSQKSIKDDILDETEQDMAKKAFQELGLNLSKNEKPQAKGEDITSRFFQYVTQDKDFTGKLVNNQTMKLPAGCTQKDNGIEYDGNLYIMRGEAENSDDPLRFECDETKTTLRQALSQAKSDDAVHNYHNHGDKVNNNSSYNNEQGTITHGNNETAVSQTQTFASMVMNGAENSTLQLDEQKNQKNKTTTTGETILDTINTDSYDGISMQELISYLNAVQQESASVKNKTGARKFAGGVDLDAKDLSNIGKVFKKYAGEDNKLQKDELQNLLNDLKQNSMSKLATGDDDKYIGEKKATAKPKGKVKPTPDTDNLKIRDGNRTRKVKSNADTKGYGDKQEYYYHDGVRTALKEVKTKDFNNNEITVTVEDDKGNIAQAGHSSLFKKRFEYIEGLPKDVRAKVVDGKIDNNNNSQEIVKVKDQNGAESYYSITTTQDKKYKLGEQLTKKKDKFLTKNQVKSEIINKLSLPDNVNIPKDLTAEYDNKGNLQFKIKNRPSSAETAKVYVKRFNSPNQTTVNTKPKTVEPDKKTTEVKTETQQPKAEQKAKQKTTHYTKTKKGLVATKLTPEEKSKIDAKAEAEGFKPTLGTEFGWYQKEVKGENRHFLWNPETQTLEIQKKVNHVTKEGKGLY